MAQSGSTGAAGSRRMTGRTAAGQNDLVSAAGCAAAAGILLGYVGSIAKATSGHLLFALIALGAVMAAYLFVARSQADPQMKAGTIVGSGIIGLVCLLVVSALMR